MRPPSLHSSFFSSLKQVEKRLKLENPTQPTSNGCTTSSIPRPARPPQQLTIMETNCTSTESLSTPLYFHFDQEPKDNDNDIRCSAPLQESSSELPLAFLSSSPQFSSPQQNPSQERPQIEPRDVTEEKSCDLDEIQLLMQLLGLSGFGGRDQGKGEDQKEGVCGDGNGNGNGGECCGFEGGFYEKIVGVKGPKCGKEVERLDGWIRYLLGKEAGDGLEEKRMEPFRLALLLLGKAALKLDEGLEFPSTIDEFLKFDPPSRD
uniref:Uncharacterized protein MANES_17G067400 n=1 Tax=Rhizophora mucronata TaxID=61149 RepID=A0A2P2P049_RHIMU